MTNIFLYIILVLSLGSLPAEGFSNINKSFAFDVTAREGRCNGSIAYPELVGGEHNPELSEINSTIKGFAEGFSVCKPVSRANQKSRYVTTYELATDSGKYLGIRWVTKQGSQIVRIDSLNFDITSGEELDVTAILSPLAKNFMHEFARLSHEHLAVDTSWDQFIAKVQNRDIQLYSQDKKWYIVFNPDQHLPHEVVIARLPNHLLKNIDRE